MSLQFQKEIYASDRFKLYINFNGICPENTTNKKDLSLSIFAIDRKKYEHVFSEELNFEEIQSLFNQLNSIAIVRNSATTHTSKFVDVNQDIADILTIVQNVDSSLVKSILDKADENDKLKLVLTALTESEIQNLHASIRQTNHQREIQNLRSLLDLEENSSITEAIKDNVALTDYAAKQPEKIFQNWIEKNIWTLGIDYIKKHPARQIGISSESDLIMETTDGFIDLIELKRPKFELFDFDNSHKSYYPSKELSKVLGQCMHYLKVIENYKLMLEKEHKFRVLKPRVKVIIGRTNKFDESKHEALRILNASLNQIQIISYDYLCLCGDNIISYYSSELEKTILSGSSELLPSMS